MLGIVLLIGVVAVSSVGIMLVASETTSEIKSQSETDRVETAFVELSQQMAEAATVTGSDASRNIELEAGERGAVAKEDTGWIRIEADNLDLNLSIGAIEYVADDGTIIAYQAGGVWREQGNETRMVSAPPIHYNSVDETFTFPVVTVSGEETLGSGDVRIAHNGTEIFRNATVIEDSSVTITVQSDYYRGWQSYFERQAGAPVVRDVDHDERIVKVRLGHIDLENAFESGLIYSSGYDGQGNGADEIEPEPVPGTAPVLDDVIEEMISDIRNGTYSEDNVTEKGTITGGTLSNGTYFADEVNLDDDLTFDLTNGNATLIVDGNVSFGDQNVSVNNWENPSGENRTLKLYTTGNIDLNGWTGPESVGEGPNARQLQLYGTSETSVGMTKGTFEGTLYAPSDEYDKMNEVVHQGHCDGYQVCFHSNPEFTGSIISHSVHFHSAANEFTYDESLQDADIDLYPDGYSVPPQLTYLNIAHHTVDVTNS